MKQHIQRLLRQKWALPAATGVVGFVTGTLVGYRFTRHQYDRIEENLETLRNKHLELDLDIAGMIEEEVKRKLESTSHHPSAFQPTLTEEPAIDLEEKRSPVRSKPLKVDLTPVEEKGKAIVTSIFSRNNDTAGDEWDYKTEIEARDNSRPYIIHVDEYVNDEMGWESQSTLTWYEGDQILCDSHDKPIYNHNEVVGELRFGHGSNDVNVVYIRNEKLQHEFEILRDEGSYEQIVLGDRLEHQAEQEELRHAHQMRFRQE